MKFLLTVNNNEYVLDAEQLERITKELEGCLLFSREYNRGEDGGDSYYTYHVFEQDADSSMLSIKTIPDATLAVAKIAGKPK